MPAMKMFIRQPGPIWSYKNAAEAKYALKWCT